MVLQGSRQGREEESLRRKARQRLKPKCYFCDTELDLVPHTFSVGPRDEPVCEECYLKTTNRQKAKAEEDREKSSG